MRVIITLFIGMLCIAANATDNLQITGTWDHNSYLVIQTPEQFDKAPMPPPTAPIKVNAVKWAKGVLTLKAGAPGKGTLVLLPTKLKLDVEFKLNEVGGVVRLSGTGTARAGDPIQGAEYELAASASRDDSGAITEFVGSIRASKAMKAKPGYEPGGQPVGTVGLFKLTRRAE